MSMTTHSLPQNVTQSGARRRWSKWGIVFGESTPQWGILYAKL
nr:MAG TPA: hypothetical protein [Caudoviricetes sp.]